MVLCRQEFAEHVDRGCPMVLGGPLPHAIAAKAVALQEASGDEFRGYARRIVDNASALAGACVNEGMTVLTGETGAGKSIIVDALSILLGDRTSGDIVRQGSDRATRLLKRFCELVRNGTQLNADFQD